MACQRDQMASGRPYQRSCDDCGLGPCKKYGPYEYPAGCYPEKIKKKPPPRSLAYSALEAIANSGKQTWMSTREHLRWCVETAHEALKTQNSEEVYMHGEPHRRSDDSPKHNDVIGDGAALVNAYRKAVEEIVELKAKFKAHAHSVSAYISDLEREAVKPWPLFQTGDFTLHSGAGSNWKIDCDALTDEDWKTLAVMIVERCGPFSRVVGVPRGGMALAEAMGPYVSERGPCLVVDDVLTTGKSILEKMAEQQRNVRMGWVVFARGPCPTGVKALFQMGWG